MTDTQRVALRAFVHGRVQGVGFRDFTMRRARELGLSGYARNLSNGASVEVVAEGSRTALDALVSALRIGPPAGHVDRVETSWSDATGAYSGFEMR